MAAFVVYLIILLAAYVRGLTKGTLNRMFVCLVVLLTITCVFEILEQGYDTYLTRFCTLADGTVDPAKIGPWWQQLCTLGYYATRQLVAPAYFIYLVLATRTSHLLRQGTRKQVLVRAPALLAFTVILTNPVTHAVFYYD